MATEKEDSNEFTGIDELRYDLAEGELEKVVDTISVKKLVRKYRNAVEDEEATLP